MDQERDGRNAANREGEAPAEDFPAQRSSKAPPGSISVSFTLRVIERPCRRYRARRGNRSGTAVHLDLSSACAFWRVPEAGLFVFDRRKREGNEKKKEKKKEKKMNTLKEMLYVLGGA